MQKRNKYLSSSSENVERVKILLAEMEETELTVQKMRAILAGCAKQLLRARFAQEELCRYQWLIEELEKHDTGCEDAEKYRKTDVPFAYVYKEDLLGELYLSLRELKERKRSGSYYTPKMIAKRLIDGLFLEYGQSNVAGETTRLEGCSVPNVTILDPACGTGSILLELPEECKLQQIYGYDIDPIAIAIIRINMALRYRIFDKKLLTEHFQVRDFLKEGSPQTVDLILGNPPWGSVFTQEEKELLKGRFQTAGQKSVESGDLFVEQSLKVLRPGGSICFVLPEALLHVKTHRIVRSLILEQSAIRRVEYLGEVFDKVQCPSVIVTLERRKPESEKAGNDIEIITENRQFTISEETSVHDNCKRRESVDKAGKRNNGITRFSEDGFLLDATEEEFALLRKLSTMESIVRLKGQARFALGIVTGNNTKHLLKQREAESETILRGSDIERFRINEVSSYIRFAPERYQQVAPAELYRAPEKLLYRFVGERPIFAYDDRQRLTLNSCNIVIPAVEGMDMRYIMAVFNSSVIEFWHRCVNHSMKLLRAHIEGFPIPVTTQEQQQEIIELVELLQENERELQIRQAKKGDAQNEMIMNELSMTRERIRIRLDWKMAELFELTDTEYELVRKACEG